MNCWKGAAKPIHSPTEIQKDLQQAGTSVSKDTISRNLHRKDLYSWSKETRVNARLKFVEMYKDKPPTFWSDETKIELFVRNTSTHVWINTDDAQARIHTSLLSINYANLLGECFYWPCLCLLKSLLAASPSEFLYGLWMSFAALFEQSIYRPWTNFLLSAGSLIIVSRATVFPFLNNRPNSVDGYT